MAIPKAEFIGKDIGGAKELLKYRWFQDTAGSTTRSPRVVTHPAETSGAGRSRLASCGSEGRGSRDRQAARGPGATCVSGRGRHGLSPGPAGAGGRGSARAGAGRCSRGALSAPPAAIPADPVQALRARHEAQGLRLHARTATPGWLGERLDVGWAIDVMHPLTG